MAVYLKHTEYNLVMYFISEQNVKFKFIKNSWVDFSYTNQAELSNRNDVCMCVCQRILLLTSRVILGQTWLDKQSRSTFFGIYGAILIWVLHTNILPYQNVFMCIKYLPDGVCVCAWPNQHKHTSVCASPKLKESSSKTNEQQAKMLIFRFRTLLFSMYV